MPKKVHIVDVDSGNLKSLTNAISCIGNYEVEYIKNDKDFEKNNDQIKRLIFPGVGNYDHFMRQVHSRNLFQPLTRYISEERALMGICVGLQTLFRDSEESSSSKQEGLRFVDMSLLKFNSSDKLYLERGIHKSVPQIGWNSIDSLSYGEAGLEGRGLFGINTINKYYFVHSFAAILEGDEKNEIIAKLASCGWNFAFAKYGSEKFLAALSYKNLFATQFHPEKSGLAGLKVIKSFLEGEKFSKISSDDVQNELRYANKDISGLTKRIIACLDVRTNDDGDLVVTKGDQYNVREAGENESTEIKNRVRNLGKPVDLAVKYYEQGADEITFLNITSFRDCPLKDLPMLQVLTRAAERIFVPLTVGGGIKDIIDPVTQDFIPAENVAELYFKSGADKVSIGSDAVAIAERYYESDRKKTGDTSIERIASTFGAQAVVVSVDPKKKYVQSPSQTSMETIFIKNPKEYGPNGEKFCYYQVSSSGGRKFHELGALELCLACEDLGAGEILLNSIDFDGSNRGYNLELLDQVKRSVKIPVIASSGAGKPEHFREVFEMRHAVDAALGAGLFHRGEYTVNQVKRYLLQNAYMDVRLDDHIKL